MTIIQIKNLFQKQLQGIYPVEEIDSFFYILSGTYLNLKRIDIALDPSKEISKNNEVRLLSALKRLIQEEPIQYILGETYFFELYFKVNRNVLIPRPETEELVTWILKDHKNDPDIKILDIGTGSGCIAVTLAKYMPTAEVTAMDISEKALQIAKINAEINHVKINLLKKDILLLKKVDQKFNIIVSNPPYVRELEQKDMNKNVLAYEPALALFVKDTDPLLFYREIATFAKRNLNHNGQLYFEINQYQGENTVKLLKDKGFVDIKLKKDIFGNDRMIKAVFNKNT